MRAHRRLVTTYMGNGSRPLEILKERYARGEIDGETYNRMKDELK